MLEPDLTSIVARVIFKHIVSKSFEGGETNA
mgnify:CR=1 FL=1